MQRILGIIAFPSGNILLFIILKSYKPPLGHTYKQKCSRGFIYMKEYIEDRVLRIADYVLDNNATVRQAARAFGTSKSTVHTVVVK
jgi:putative DeoR family transcriptional regulator, stage III sporulation protein D